MSIILKDLIAFLKKPIDRILSKDIVKNKFLWFIGIFLINTIFVLIYMLLASLLESSGLINQNDHKIANMIDKPILLFISAVFVAPIIEELVFRYQLTFRSNYILKGFIYATHKLYHQDYQSTSNRYKSLWDKYFTYVFYSVAIIFALIHTMNFIDVNYFLLPLLVLPQFVIGLLIGYLRIRIGFLWGYLLHFVNNFLALLLMYVSIIGYYNNDVNITNEKFDLKINTQFKFESPNDSKGNFNNDSIILKNYNLKFLISSINNIQSSKIEYENSLFKNIIININYVNKDVDSLNKTFLVDTLLHMLDAEVVKESSKKQNFVLVISDSSLLDEHYDYDTSTLINTDNDTLRFTNIRLNSVAETINNLKSIIINSDFGNKDAYTFSIPNGNLEEIDKYLNKNIGLDLEPRKSKSMIYKIKSK